ncbi:DMT family transporter [Aquabacterium sp. A7-Y]|uniref:DMT family transporter n=1 Tax=Aquabacterium sp. A7-Y TaxID=1349605 RepID=UPI00223E0959|nr:DMT family transporter [Aquabacterium sp. A7-Y]MCW7540041.1 DMT family transporter [Aquabacterium sp. A7-Y]
MSPSPPLRPPAAAAASLPVVALIFNAAVWGLSWWPLRALHAGHGLHPLWATVAIFVLSTTALLAWRPAALEQLRRQPVLWVLAAAAGATNAAFNWAVSIGDVMRVVLLFYLMPLWSALFARVILHERFTPQALLRVGLALAGAVIVLKPAGAPWPLPQGLPDWLGLLAGLCFAFNSVMLRRLAPRTREEGRAVAMLLGGVVMAALLALGLGRAGAVAGPPALGLAWLLPVAGLGLCFLLSNLAYQFGAARLPAAVTAVVMLTEVAFASASSVLLGEARLSPQVLLGGALIVAAAVLAALQPSR